MSPSAAWFKYNRTHCSLNYRTPAEVEADYYDHQSQPAVTVRKLTTRFLTIPGPVHQTNRRIPIFRQFEQAGVDLPELKRFAQRTADGGKDERRMTQELWDEQGASVFVTASLR